jgi:ATP-dependent RNA helicase SUPV3L1/SUV3
MTVDEPAQERPQPDFSSLQGLQVVGDGPWTDEGAQDDAIKREAITLDLEARAARFHQSVDASIVLANDGTLRWLGDPIAKLSAGSDLLTPSAVILADSRLPDGARQTVAARIELWLGAQTRRLLGPLFSLRDLEEGPDPVRDLAGRIARSLGVLERDAVRNQVKAFDQNARATLRRHGVRFGAYYIYVPTVLKPAARALALQLWGLQTPGVDSDALSQALAPMASSGRTSLPFDQQVTREGYRVAGFRPCGERVVRVDIVERLADLIRAAFIQPGAESMPRMKGGFIVNGQMTSLTGCSGEAFSSILRSLGFESTVINRSELPGPPAHVGQPGGGVTARVGGEEPAEPERAPKPPGDPSAGSGGGLQAIEPDPPAAPAAEELEGGGVQEAQPSPAAEPEAAGDPEAAADPEGAAEPEAEAEAAVQPEAATEPEAAADAEAIAEPEAAADAEDIAEPEAAAGPGAPAGPETVSTAADPTDVEKPLALPETITIWRPVRRSWPPRPSHGQRAEGGSSTAKAHPPQPAQGGESASLHVNEPQPRPRKRRRWESHPGEQEKGARPPLPGRSEGSQSDEHRRQPAGNRVAPRPKPSSAPPPPAVDPDSPFAKLLELRSLLEKQGKNRR